VYLDTILDTMVPSSTGEFISLPKYIRESTVHGIMKTDLVKVFMKAGSRRRATRDEFLRHYTDKKIPFTFSCDGFKYFMGKIDGEISAGNPTGDELALLKNSKTKATNAYNRKKKAGEC
jgi:hypothetical protein